MRHVEWTLWADLVFSLWKSGRNVEVWELWAGSKSGAAGPARIIATAHFYRGFYQICPGLVQTLGRLFNRNAMRNAKLTNKNVKKCSSGGMPRGDDLFHKYLESFWPLESMSSESLKKTFRWCHWRENFNLSFQPLKWQLKVRGEKNKNKFCPFYGL